MELVQIMAFVGRAAAVIRESVVTRVTANYVFIQGREWSNEPGRFNADHKFHADGSGIGGSELSMRAKAV